MAIDAPLFVTQAFSPVAFYPLNPIANKARVRVVKAFQPIFIGLGMLPNSVLAPLWPVVHFVGLLAMDVGIAVIILFLSVVLHEFVHGVAAAYVGSPKIRVRFRRSFDLYIYFEHISDVWLTQLKHDVIVAWPGTFEHLLFGLVSGIGLVSRFFHHFEFFVPAWLPSWGLLWSAFVNLILAFVSYKTEGSGSLYQYQLAQGRRPWIKSNWNMATIQVDVPYFEFDLTSFFYLCKWLLNAPFAIILWLSHPFRYLLRLSQNRMNRVMMNGA